VMRSCSMGKGARSVTPTRTPSSTTASRSESVGIQRFYGGVSRPPARRRHRLHGHAHRQPVGSRA
jgi:hypothetical protein